MSYSSFSKLGQLMFVLCWACGNAEEPPGSGGMTGSGASGSGGSTAGSGGTAGNSDGSGPEACFRELAPAPGERLEIQRFRTEDSSVQLWRARQTTPAPTVGETRAFELVRFWVDSERDPDTCVSLAAALEYEYAHHNWDENWRATTPNTEYAGREVFDISGSQPTWSDSLTISTLTGEALGSALALIDEGCTSQPYDLNVCVLRTRLDRP